MTPQKEIEIMTQELEASTNEIVKQRYRIQDLEAENSRFKDFVGKVAYHAPLILKHIQDDHHGEHPIHDATILEALKVFINGAEALTGRTDDTD